MVSSDKREIINLHFNQEHSMFTCCMESGLRLYNLDPLSLKTSLGNLKSHLYFLVKF